MRNHLIFYSLKFINEIMFILNYKTSKCGYSNKITQVTLQKSARCTTHVINTCFYSVQPDNAQHSAN